MKLVSIGFWEHRIQGEKRPNCIANDRVSDTFAGTIIVWYGNTTQPWAEETRELFSVVSEPIDA